MTRIWIALAALASTFTVPALAAEPGFYLGASVGRAEEDPKSNGTNIAIGLFPSQIQHIDPTRVDADNSGAAWGAAAGYRFNRYIAAEVEYMDFGTADVSETYDLSAILPTLPGVPTGTPILITPAQLTRTYSSRVKGPALSMLGTLPVGKAWDLFLRAGVLFADRKIEVGQSIGLGDTTFGSTVWLAGVGADWSFANRWALRAEYQHTGKLDSNFLVGETELDRVALSVLFKL
jgi:opacity protein-like surface antigen